MKAFNPTTVDIPPYGVVQFQWDRPSKWTPSHKDMAIWSRPSQLDSDGSIVALVYPHQSGVTLPAQQTQTNAISMELPGNGAELSSWRYQDSSTMAVAGPNGIPSQRFGEVRTDWPLLARVRDSDISVLLVGEDLATCPYEWHESRDASRNAEAFDLRRVQDGAFVCMGVDAKKKLAVVTPRVTEKPQPTYLAYMNAPLTWNLGRARDGEIHIPTGKVIREDGLEYDTDRGCVHIINPGAYVFGYAMTLRSHDFMSVSGFEPTFHHQWKSGILFWYDKEYDSPGSSATQWNAVARGYAMGSFFFDNMLAKQHGMGIFAGQGNGPDYLAYNVLPVKAGEFFETHWGTGFLTISNPMYVLLGADCGTHAEAYAAEMAGRTVVSSAHMWYQRIGTHANGLQRLRVNGRNAQVRNYHEHWRISPIQWSR